MTELEDLADLIAEERDKYMLREAGRELPAGAVRSTEKEGLADYEYNNSRWGRKYELVMRQVSGWKVIKEKPEVGKI